MQRRAASESEPVVAALWDCLADNDRRRVEQFLELVQQTFVAPFAIADGQPPKRSAKRKAK
jgi:hypothetical protein